jgi:hypothetical protein
VPNETPQEQEQEQELRSRLIGYYSKGEKPPASLYVRWAVAECDRLADAFEGEAPDIIEYWRTRGADEDDPRWQRLRDVEQAAYSWWEEYGEHPSFTNLRSRMVAEFGYSEARAADLIVESINDSGFDGYLWGVHKVQDAIARHRFLPDHVFCEGIDWSEPDDYVFAVDRRMHSFLRGRMLFAIVQDVVAARDRRRAS